MRKGIIRITIGLILIFLQIMSVIGNTISGGNFDLADDGIYGIVYLLGYFLPGMLGVTLFVWGSSEFSKKNCQVTNDYENMTTCDEKIHENYKSEVKSVVEETSNGKWQYNSVVGERVFVCNHCNSVILYESDFKSED